MHPPSPLVPPGWSPCDPFPALKPLRSFLDDTGCRRIGCAWHTFGAAANRPSWPGPGSGPPPKGRRGTRTADRWRRCSTKRSAPSAWLVGHQVVVARLVVDFREMVPLGTDATVEASVVAVDGRKVTCRARLTDGATLLAEAEALCVTRDFAALSERILNS